MGYSYSSQNPLPYEKKTKGGTERVRGCAAGSVEDLRRPGFFALRNPDEGGASPGRNKLSFAYIDGRFLRNAEERRRGCVNVCITPI